MKITNKILLVLVTVLLSCGIIIISIWYSASQKLTNTYLSQISESTMKDAYHAFEYLLTDTSYMATLISTNATNIIEPVQQLRNENIKDQGQWNQVYLDNKRTIMNFIRGINGYKYYIVGITVVASEECIFSATHLLQNEDIIYEEISRLDQQRLKTGMAMMDPIHVEGGKSTLSSDYVVPAVRGILNEKQEIIGYTVLYFDYGVIDKMFSANLPEGSYFQVRNMNDAVIFANFDNEIAGIGSLGSGYRYHTFKAEQIGWNFTMAIPTEFFMADIRHTAVMTGAIVFAILVVGGLVAAFMVSRMTTEITVLRNSMNEVSGGNMEVRYQIKSMDEIGEIGDAFNEMIGRIQELLVRVAEEEHQKRRSQIAFLQAQINPHFISNVLNNVVWMAKIQHADNLVPLVNSLNSLLQNAMHQEQDMIRLSDELTYVDHYLTIAEYSGSYDFTVEKELEDGIGDLYILRFILQPIIENAIHHGLPDDLSRSGTIRIAAWQEDEILWVSVTDNGCGMSETQLQEIMSGTKRNRAAFNNIGVPNVIERIRLFYGEQYGLQYESVEGEYTRAVFRLPVTREADG